MFQRYIVIKLRAVLGDFIYTIEYLCEFAAFTLPFKGAIKS